MGGGMITAPVVVAAAAGAGAIAIGAEALRDGGTEDEAEPVFSVKFRHIFP